MSTTGQPIPVIAIDGPSGSGKGTVARQVAAALGFHLLDSGALYRLVALAGQGAGVADEAGLAALAGRLRIEFGSTAAGAESIRLDGREVAAEVRLETTGALASQVAAMPAVRTALLDRQRGFVRAPGLVADGRDMGTVVFPDARLKVFLTASPEERARRRHNQLIDKGNADTLRALSRDIAERDARDSNRAVAPLRPAPDAIVVDSTGVPVDRVVAEVLRAARDRFALDQ
jgi:cytidylate kinase